MSERVSDDSPSTSERDVLLIRMPFGALDYPSIGLSLLKAGLAQCGIRSKILYLSAKFGALTGPEYYNLISRLLEDDHSVAGDWVFTDALYGKRDPAPQPPRFLAETSRQFARSLTRMHRRSEGFLDFAMKEIERANPRIVGFSCVYQQRIASLALARRIKACRPETFVVFGGPECHSAKGRELLRQFPFVDAVVPGEGDLVFPVLAERVLRRQDWADLGGVYGRQSGDKGFFPESCRSQWIVRDLDALPFPDYDDYFDQLKQNDLEMKVDPFLFVEGSRGCWWGKCRFCSLNGADASYRSKSPSRLLKEVAFLSHSYGVKTQKLFFVDNILNVRLLRDFFPTIADRQLGLEISLEVKSNLKKHQLRTLHEAGVTRVQPGIESLNTRVLELMCKGVDALQNIQLLKWCKELGINTSWNIIWGFPGEQPEDYLDMARLVPLLTHLDPPTGFGQMALGRHSEYYENSAALGLTNIKPNPVYNDIFPFDHESVASLAEFFKFDYQSGKPAEDHIENLRKEVNAWIRVMGKVELFFIDTGEQILIWDERDCAHDRLTRLCGIQSAIYRVCDTAMHIRQIQALCGACAQPQYSIKKLEDMLQPLLERGLMIREGRRYLSLAIAVGIYSPGAGLRRFRRHRESLEAQARQDALRSMLPVRELPDKLWISRREVRRCLERLMDTPLNTGISGDQRLRRRNGGRGNAGAQQNMTALTALAHSFNREPIHTSELENFAFEVRTPSGNRRGGYDKAKHRKDSQRKSGG